MMTGELSMHRWVRGELERGQNLPLTVDYNQVTSRSSFMERDLYLFCSKKSTKP